MSENRFLSSSRRVSRVCLNVIMGLSFNGNPASLDPTLSNIGLGGRDVLKPLHEGLRWARGGACGW